MMRMARMKRKWQLLTLAGIGMLALGIIGVSGWLENGMDAGAPPISGESSGSYGPGPLWSLEEMIASHDATVARVNLQSIAAVTEEYHAQDERQPQRHLAALEFTFEVLEYLHGSGGKEIKAVLPYSDWAANVEFDTELEAAEKAADLTSLRDARGDNRWDDREAVVFLSRHPRLPTTLQGDRYYIGRIDRDPRYSASTIASSTFRTWFPAIVEQTVVTSMQANEEGQTFLLKVPSEEGATALNGTDSNTAETITLNEMRALVSMVRADIDAGDGSRDYRHCVSWKYRILQELPHSLANDLWDDHWRDGYHFDIDLESGLPEGSQIYVSSRAARMIETYGDERPSGYINSGHWIYGVEWLGGRDPGLFTSGYPYTVWTARPLADGEYKFHYYVDHTICGAIPEEVRSLGEWTVTVTAPAGTVHEAFFDPVSLTGSGVGADTTANGDLSPAAFTIGDADSALQSLTWQGGSVVLTLSPYTSLAGNAVDFIELDASVSLTLSVDAATVDSAAGTLTWSVATQPWHDGDLLMLRIRDAAVPAQTPVPTVQPTVEPTVIPTVEPTLEPTVVPTVEPTAIPTPEPTAVPSPSVSAVSLSFSPGTTVKSRVWVSLSVEVETVPANEDVEMRIQVQSGNNWITVSTGRFYGTTTTNGTNTYRGGARISGSTDEFTYSAPLTITWTP